MDMTIDEAQLGHGANDRPEHYGRTGAARHAEISAAMPPAAWVEKDPVSGFQTYPKRSQGLAGDCVEFSFAKAIAVDFLNLTGIYRDLSPHSVYPFCFEAGGGSNSLTVGRDVIPKIGMTLESLFPSENLTEAQAESADGYPLDAKKIALLYRVPGVNECPADFETIASVLQAYQSQGKKKAVLVTLIAQNNGMWYSRTPVPPSLPPTAIDKSLWYHKVPVCDFGLIGGQKVLAIDNSWGTQPGNGGQQFLTKAYEPYVYGGLYTMDPPSSPGTAPTPPKYQWSVNLAVGSSGPDVLALQQALQSMGFFPVSSIIAPTGSFYGITKQAVATFQQSVGIPATGIVDSATRARLNSIFG